MPEKEYIAYEGDIYTIEWYYDESEKSQSLDYFMKLRSDMQMKVMYLFKRIGDNGKINDTTKFQNEGDSIYAFKPQPHRFLSFFVKGKRIIVTNAFHKKTEKLPKNEKLKATHCRESYCARVARGTYYEK
ncbi:MAG: type II toxin-antitoxin system RelE/ParE family toxin [Spirochaetes bacterium]|nr:type II toxin-antitoxin system RelE/ParE family toxin [Spirochaetota bacterium]